MAEITAFLEQRLKLKVNADKSAVARPWQRKFLGYSVTWHRKPKLKIAQSSRQRFAEKIRQTLRGARGQSLRQIIDQRNPILRGWVAYFRLTEELPAGRDGWLASAPVTCGAVAAMEERLHTSAASDARGV